MRKSSPQTQPLWASCPPRSPGEHIPRLGDGQGFKLLALERESPGVSIYRMYALDPVRICPECGHYNEPVRDSCVVCGHDMAEVHPAPAVAMLYEACDVQRLAPFVYLPAKQITHPHLLAPILAQTIRDRDGSQRYQLFIPERPAPPLQERDGSAPLGQVLRWGMQIAQALAALHGVGFSHGAIDSEHILVRESRAWLLAAPGDQARPAATISGDLRALAFVLMRSMGLQPSPQGLSSLPEPVRKAFAPALNQALPEANAAQLFGQLLAFAQQSLHAEKDRRLLSAWGTDDGQQRDHNEDSLLVNQWEVAREGLPTGCGLYLVADGAGGHEAGEVASQTAVQIIGQRLAPALADSLWGEQTPSVERWRDRVREAILAANQRIREMQQQRANNMLTTLALLMIVRDRAILAHVGDSRIYLWRGGQLRQLTTDHTTVQQLIAMNQISREQARTHPRRHELYRALGHKEDPKPDLNIIPLEANDVFLICSDGLYDELDDNAIARLIQTSSTPQDAAHTLIRAANDAGGSDNISVILVRIASNGQ